MPKTTIPDSKDIVKVVCGLEGVTLAGWTQTGEMGMMRLRFWLVFIGEKSL